MLVDRVDRASAIVMLRGFLRDGGRHQIVTVNLDFMRLADRDPAYRAVLNRADLAVADGMPLVWFSRLGTASLPERVAGIDLVEQCCRLATEESVPVFFLGALPGVAAEAARVLSGRYPGLRIAGTYSPPFGPASSEGDEEIVRVVSAAGRCVLLVAFGAPRQDRFISDHLHEFDAAIAMGVGGSFDIFAGTLRRAPFWMQRTGFEWIWRLMQEPRRLWRRYLVEDVPFILRLGARAARGRIALDVG